MNSRARGSRSQRGITLIGLVLWAIVIGAIALVVLKVFPTVNEYWTILRAVNKIAGENPATVQDVRTAFEKQKEIEYSISSIDGKDLAITKENERLVIRFAYDKEVELVSPVFLLIKYRGEGKSSAR
jgi:hypothetical protein